MKPTSSSSKFCQNSKNGRLFAVDPVTPVENRDFLSQGGVKNQLFFLTKLDFDEGDFQSQIVTENDLLSCIAKVLFSLGRLWDIFGSLLDGLGLLWVDFGSFWVALELLLATLGILWDDLGSLWVGNLGNNKTFAQCFKITKKELWNESQIFRFYVILKHYCDTFQMFEFLRLKWAKWTFENPKIYFFFKMNAAML